jgi:hypothetical protein
LAPNALLSQPPIKKVEAIAPEQMAFSKAFAKEKAFPLHECNKHQGQPCVWRDFLMIFLTNTTTSTRCCMRYLTWIWRILALKLSPDSLFVLRLLGFVMSKLAA